MLEIKFIKCTLCNCTFYVNVVCCYLQRTGGGRAKSGRKGGRSKGSNVFIFPQIPEAYDPLTNKVRVLRDLKG